MEKETEVQKRVNEDKFNISRLPKWARNIIAEKADAEHCGDRGACIAQILRDAIEYDSLKTRFFNNTLDVSIVINDKHSESATEQGEIKAANGKVIKRRNK